MQRYLLAVIVMAGCSSSDGAVQDAGLGDDANACVPYSETTCFMGNAHWSDGCGAVLEVIEECGAQETCSAAYGKCCAQPVSSGVVPAYPWPLRLDWTFLSGGAELIADVMVVTDPGDALEMTFDVDLTIDGAHVYFALENGLPPEPGSGSKKGVRLYRVGTSSPDDARTTVGTLESNVLGDGQIVVRNHRNWPPGSRHRLRLARAEVEGEADWFDLKVSDGAGVETTLGGVRVPRAVAGVPATIAADSRTWFKLLNFDWLVTGPPLLNGEPGDYSDIRDVSMRVDVTMGDVSLTKVESSYGRDAADNEWLNTEAGIVDEALQLSWGPTVTRCTAAGLLR